MCWEPPFDDEPCTDPLELCEVVWVDPREDAAMAKAKAWQDLGSPAVRTQTVDLGEATHKPMPNGLLVRYANGMQYLVPWSELFSQPTYADWALVLDAYRIEAAADHAREVG